MKQIPIPNAEWWMPHSQCIAKGRLLAGDTAAITNGIVSADIVNGTPVMVTKGGNINILKVQRMISYGKVAVMDPDGEIHEVTLPEQADQLFDTDLNYICAQIDAKSRPLTLEEQKAFLASANGRLETSSNLESLSPMSS
jgi:hypothetical protein